MGCCCVDVSSSSGTGFGTASTCGTLGSFECRVGDGSPAVVGVSAPVRIFLMLDLGVPNRRGEIVVGRFGKRGGDGAASEIYGQWISVLENSKLEKSSSVPDESREVHRWDGEEVACMVNRREDRNEPASTDSQMKRLTVVSGESA